MENKHKILIIDDDKANLELLSVYLKGEGFICDVAENGAIGLERIRANNYSLILLDVMMPEIDGHEFIKLLRKSYNTPVVFITARDNQQDINKGFLLGCDDYVVKPFDLTELKLRINALLKRAERSKDTLKAIDSDIISYKDITINTISHQIKKGSQIVSFTSKEFEIVKLLFSNIERVYSAKMIYELIWNDIYLAGDRTVLTHIGNIREKLGDNIKHPIYIKTIWGVGYKIEKENI